MFTCVGIRSTNKCARAPRDKTMARGTGAKGANVQFNPFSAERDLCRFAVGSFGGAESKILVLFEGRA